MSRADRLAMAGGFMVMMGWQIYMDRPNGSNQTDANASGQEIPFLPTTPEAQPATTPQSAGTTEMADVSVYTHHYPTGSYIVEMKYNMGWWVVKAAGIQANSLEEALAQGNGAVEAVIEITPGEPFDFNQHYGRSHFRDGYQYGPSLGPSPIAGSGICNVAEALYQIATQQPELTVSAPTRTHPPMPGFTKPDVNGNEQGVIIDTGAWSSANLYITNNGDSPVQILARYDGTTLSFGTR